MAKKKKSFRVFDFEGRPVRFNSDAFNLFFKSHAQRNGKKIGEQEEQMAEEIGVSKSTVHAWRQGQTGPISMELIGAVSDYFELDDISKLLREVEEDKVDTLTDRQLDAVKRIYDKIIEFFDYFRRTDGFCSLSIQFMKKYGDNNNIMDMVHDHIDKWIHENVEMQYEKEWFDLHDTAIYVELGDFVYDSLAEMYGYIEDDDYSTSPAAYLEAQKNAEPGDESWKEEFRARLEAKRKAMPEKCSIDYRFERPLQGLPGGKSVSQELDEANMKLMDIICRYTD